MAWLRIDDQFFSHPKVLAAGNEAIGLWVRLLTWSGAHLTDGFVPFHATILFQNRALKRNLTRLVKVGLLHETEGGYNIHDYLEWNPSASQVLDEREKNAARARRHRKRNAKRNASVTRDADRTCGVNSDVPSPSPSPSPSSSPSQQQACQNEAEPVNLGRAPDDDDKNCHLWGVGDPITNATDLEAFVAEQGWGITVSPRDRGKAASLIRAGPIAPHEINEGLARVGSATPDRPVSYWLKCVETARREYHEAKKRGQSKPIPEFDEETLAYIRELEEQERREQEQE
jgi:hypothetical protein